MPASHVLKDNGGRTISEVTDFCQVTGTCFGRRYGETMFNLYAINELTVVNRRELLAGQVLL